MSTFTISMWLEVEANNHEEAWEMAQEIEGQILERVSYVNSVGSIDVEEQEE